MAARPRVSLVSVAYYRGLDGFEPSTIAVFAALARQAQVIVDVGANAGIFALLAAGVNPQARILAFEPHPLVAMSLAKNVALSGAHGVEVFPTALGTETAYTKLYTSISDSLTSLDEARVESAVAVTVPMTTLDAITTERGVNGIGLIKVDVEGWELPVFQGGAATLARDRPVVVFEALADAPAAAIDDFFARLDYRILVITARSLQPVTLASPWGAGAAPERNFVAVPVERVAAVRALADGALAAGQTVGENVAGC
jgi:FkbM family methyltransferase